MIIIIILFLNHSEGLQNFRNTFVEICHTKNQGLEREILGLINISIFIYFHFFIMIINILIQLFI